MQSAEVLRKEPLVPLQQRESLQPVWVSQTIQQTAPNQPLSMFVAQETCTGELQHDAFCEAKIGCFWRLLIIFSTPEHAAAPFMAADVHKLCTSSQ